MAEVEHEARLRGCRLVMGLTYDVLIGDFYDRLGYRTIGLLKDCPAGTTTRWYCKDLLAGSPASGPSRVPVAREVRALHWLSVQELPSEPVGNSGNTTVIVNPQDGLGGDFDRIGEDPHRGRPARRWPRPRVEGMGDTLVQLGAECEGDAVHLARWLDHRSVDACTDGSSKAVRSNLVSSIGGPTGGQVATTSPSVMVCVGPGIAASSRGVKSMS